MNKRRPIRFNPDHSDLARKFFMLGATNEDLARLLEVPPWMARNFASAGRWDARAC